MTDKENPQEVIQSYRKRQQKAQRAPIIIAIAAVLLIAGAAILIFWVLGPDGPSIPLSFLATETSTPTNTSTPSPTATITLTPTNTATDTATPTITLTETPSGPFIYQVEEGDNLWAIAEKFQVDLLVLITLNNLDPANPTILVGDKLTIPTSDTELPTATALPTNIRQGTQIEYQVQSGDSLLSIALSFNSTVDAIKEENEVENENEIFVGQVLIIPVNLVTAVPTATETPALEGVELTVTPTP